MAPAQRPCRGYSVSSRLKRPATCTPASPQLPAPPHPAPPGAVVCQFGHLLNSKFHHGGYCAFVKGGSGRCRCAVPCKPHLWWVDVGCGHVVRNPKVGGLSHHGLALTLLRSLLGHRRQRGAPLRRPGHQLGAGALSWVHLYGDHAFYAAWAFTQQGPTWSSCCRCTASCPAYA